LPFSKCLDAHSLSFVGKKINICKKGNELIFLKLLDELSFFIDVFFSQNIFFINSMFLK